MKNAPTSAQRREHFRLTYPLGSQPVLVVNGECYDICEISEGGLRFASESNTEYLGKKLIEANIHFPDGTKSSVEGKVLRQEKNETVFELFKHVSHPIIIAQQALVAQLVPA
jgi:PilZ domain